MTENAPAIRHAPAHFPGRPSPLSTMRRRRSQQLKRLDGSRPGTFEDPYRRRIGRAGVEDECLAAERETPT